MGIAQDFLILITKMSSKMNSIDIFIPVAIGLLCDVGVNAPIRLAVQALARQVIT